CFSARKSWGAITLYETTDNPHLFERRENLIRKFRALPGIVNHRPNVLDTELSDFIEHYDFFLCLFIVENKDINMFAELVRYYLMLLLLSMSFSYNTL